MIDVSAISSGSDNLLHWGGVRMRIQGAGDMKLTWQSLDTVRTSDLAPLTMAENPGLEPFKLSNFIAQRAFLYGTTTVLNDFFSINKIIVYVREYGTQFVGQ